PQQLPPCTLTHNALPISEREDLPDNAAHGESYEVRPRDAQPAQQPVEVVRQLVETVRAGRRARLPVSARVEAEHAIALAQGADLDRNAHVCTPVTREPRM